MLKDLCKKCLKFTSCEEPCEDLEKLLPEPLDWETKGGKVIVKRGRENTEADLDKMRGDDLRDYEIEEVGNESGEGSEHTARKETFWDKFDQNSAPPLNEKEYGLLRNYIDKAIPGRKKTIKNRFLAFMRCENMTNIARRSNVTKQNVQKQFVSIIARMSRFEFLADRFVELREKKLTPKQMKTRFLVEKWYAF
jgi:hypothetical protein